MKRKAATLLTIIVAIAGFCGCGSQTDSGSIDVSEVKEQSEFSDEESAAENEAEDGIATESLNDDKTRPLMDGVVFGSDKAVGYDGFKYLVEQTISTSNTESGNEVSYSVYVPDSDDTIERRIRGGYGKRTGSH